MNKLTMAQTITLFERIEAKMVSMPDYAFGRACHILARLNDHGDMLRLYSALRGIK